MVIVLMGVTGSGKTTVGKLLARDLGWKFLEGDGFHPPANIDKLRHGMALTDQERKPWLSAIAEAIRSAVARGDNVVISCSALKASYRRMLAIDRSVGFVYLHAPPSLIRERLQKRPGHFMNPSLIQSQFDTLEKPQRALRVDAALPPGEIVEIIKRRLNLPRAG
jgi:gluconokinase